MEDEKIIDLYWDNNAFGYLRRLFNAGLDVNEFSITPQEEETFVRGTEGFTMNGVSFSTCLTVKELLINGWEITGRAREAGDIDSDNNVRIFTDAYSMTDGTGTIIVYLNWEDASSGMMTKDCRVSSIDLGNCDSFITGGFELEGITREQLDYYNKGDGNRILCRYTVDMLTGDPVYDYWA